MTDYTYIGNKAKSLSVSPSLPAYTGVRIHYEDEDGQEQTYWYGDESGSVLDFEMPWPNGQNSQSQLEAIGQYVYNQIQGKVYTPFDASAAKLDLAAEIGDAVLVGSDTYSVLANIVTEYDAAGLSEVKAGGNSDLEHEFPYKSAVERSIQNLSHITSQLRVDADNISAKVESAEGDISSLEIDVGGILAQVTDAQGNYTVLTMTANGLVVRGNSGNAVEINGGQLKAGTVLGDRLVADVFIQSPTIYGGEYYSGSALAKLELDETFSSGYTYPALIFSSTGVDAHEVFRVDEIYPGSNFGKIERMLMFEDVIMSYWKDFSTAPDTLYINASVLSLPGVVIAGNGSFGTAEPPVTGNEQQGQLYFQLVGY